MMVICEKANDGNCYEDGCRYYNTSCSEEHGIPHRKKQGCDKYPKCVEYLEDFFEMKDFEL